MNIFLDPTVSPINDIKLSDTKAIISRPPQSLGNPVTTYFPGHPRAVFLQELNIKGSAWMCNCDGIGYVNCWVDIIANIPINMINLWHYTMNN